MNTNKIYAESIAKDYAPKDNSKIVALKKLDNRAKLPATIFTYSCGIISSLILILFGVFLALLPSPSSSSFLAITVEVLCFKFHFLILNSQNMYPNYL